MSEHAAEHAQVDASLEDTFPASDIPKTVPQSGVVLDPQALQAAPAVSTTIRRMLVSGLVGLHQAQLRSTHLLNLGIESGGSALRECCESQLQAVEGHAHRLNRSLAHFGASTVTADDAPLAQTRALGELSEAAEPGPVRDLALAFALRTAIQQDISAYEVLEILARRVKAPEVTAMLQDSLLEERDTVARVTELVEETLLAEVAGTRNADLPGALIEKALGGTVEP